MTLARLPSLDAIAGFIAAHRRLFVLTGAGCSTASGIPDYRNAAGTWKHRQPIQYQDFVRHESVRRRYWARSLIGWRRFADAAPNPAHYALAQLEARGRIVQLVTQNVDGLHQRAGSRRIIDLHGRLDAVACLACGRSLGRDTWQQTLETRNPAFCRLDAASAPDGDARLGRGDFDDFHVPPCGACGGVLKPAVVFFGESVPPERVRAAYDALAAADAMLVVGSSLMVYSGYRFCQAAAARGQPIAGINLGRTRADTLFALKLEAPCAEALPAAVRAVEAASFAH